MIQYPNRISAIEFNVLLAQTQIVKHIAQIDLAREILRDHDTPPINYARILLEEARYQQWHGQTSEVVRLAAEAREMFINLELTDDATIAEKLIHAPETAA